MLLNGDDREPAATSTGWSGRMSAKPKGKDGRAICLLIVVLPQGGKAPFLRIQLWQLKHSPLLLSCGQHDFIAPALDSIIC